MTRVVFTADKGGLCGFSISGHSSINCDDFEGKLVCSAVSSAAYLVANTVTEVIGDECTALVDDAEMTVNVKNASPASRQVLEGLRLHLNELSKQYKKHIRIITEV